MERAELISPSREAPGFRKVICDIAKKAVEAFTNPNQETSNPPCPNITLERYEKYTGKAV